MSSTHTPFLVYVDSSNRLKGSHSHSNFKYLINFPKDKIFSHAVVINALIPKAWYLVDYPYNTFKLQEDNKSVEIVVAPGNYNISQFKHTVTNLLTNASPNNLQYVLTYPKNSMNPDLGKWIFSQSNSQIGSSFIFTDCLYEQFGFDPNTQNFFDGSSLLSNNCVKFQSEDRVLIRSDIINNNSDNDIFVSINASAYSNFSTISYLNPHPSMNNHVLQSQNNSVYSFQITDEKSRLLSTGGLNVNFTIAFYFKDQIYDNIRSFLKVLLNGKNII